MYFFFSALAKLDVVDKVPSTSAGDISPNAKRKLPFGEPNASTAKKVSIRTGDRNVFRQMLKDVRRQNETKSITVTRHDPTRSDVFQNFQAENFEIKQELAETNESNPIQYTYKVVTKTVVNSDNKIDSKLVTKTWVENKCLKLNDKKFN